MERECIENEQIMEPRHAPDHSHLMRADRSAIGPYLFAPYLSDPYLFLPSAIRSSTFPL
jgi:hypothetical protein